MVEDQLDAVVLVEVGRKAVVMAVTVPNDSNIRKKEEEKVERSQDLRASAADVGRADRTGPLRIAALGAVTPELEEPPQQCNHPQKTSEHIY